MPGTAEYRFLPWTRRGLAAEVAGADGPAARLPERARVTVGLTVTGAGSVPGVDLTLYGPGDVLGIDPRLITRTDPRRNATDVEPNYLPAIEFDPPDLPWMFTPAASGANQRLRPWVVLVCVDTEVVAAPHLKRGDARGPLPVIEVPAAAVADELPDLTESWAWAHTQVATDDDAGPVTPEELATAPTLNVSRLLCPRRLRPGRRYAACVVPAFDAGVRRGLTGAPPNPPGTTAPPLGAAWNVAAPADVVLPVYFHWEFTTGPGGDFEELAGKLRPFACPPTVGFAPMYVGSAGPDLPAIGSGKPGARLDMDGALRAPTRAAGTLNDVNRALRQALQRTVNAAAEHADGKATRETPVMGPPLYGEWHTGRHRVPATEYWFTEANLDPRARVAAGLATEVVRREQEDLMHAAWEQVGRVQDANALLTLGRLAIEVGRRWHERHLAPLPAHRLAQLTAPLGARVLFGERTVHATVAASSLADAAGDPALRRLTGGRHRIIRHAARQPLAERPTTVPSKLYANLAAGRGTVDPNVFDRDGLVTVAALGDVMVPRTGTDDVDLTAVGLPLTVAANVLRDGLTRFRAVETSVAGRDEGMTAGTVSLREDLRTVGMLTKAHLRELGNGPLGGGTVLEAGALPTILDAVRTAAAANPRAIAFRVDTAGTRPRVDALDVDGRGNLVVRGQDPVAPVVVGRLAGAGLDADTARISAAIDNLPPGTLPSARQARSAEPPVIDVPGRGPVTEPMTEPSELGAPTQSVASPIRDLAVISRYEAAWAGVRATLTAVPPVPRRRAVPFPVSTAATAVLTATNSATTVPRRLASMLTVGGTSLFARSDPTLEVAPTMDRVLAYPELPIPAYELLARYDPDRFVPGIGVLPPNAITLLETNPRFVEAFLLGLNHEMNRELLWREYPTDRRGTPLRHFWSWADGKPDIPPIHQWRDQTKLGGTARGAGEGQLVLLIRGDLLRRYPNTVVVAWRAKDGKLKEPPAAGDIVHHVFDGWFAPDVTLFGFPLTETALATGWFFVLTEQPTEPRFGFDEGPAGPLTSWLSATWAHTGTEPGAHLVLTGNPLANRTIGGVTFGRNGGHLAAVALQRPVRVAVASSEIVAP